MIRGVSNKSALKDILARQVSDLARIRHDEATNVQKWQTDSKSTTGDPAPDPLKQAE